MSAQPVYAAPTDIRSRLDRLSAAEQRVASRERALEARIEALADAEAHTKQLEAANRKRARVAKAAGADLAAMNAQLAERKRLMARKIQETEHEMTRLSLPSVWGGPDGLYRAVREIEEHERKKKRLARQTGQ